VKERESEGKKKQKATKKGKGFGISSTLKEDASQEFLLIYLPICSLCGLMERGRGRREGKSRQMSATVCKPAGGELITLCQPFPETPARKS